MTVVVTTRGLSRSVRGLRVREVRERAERMLAALRMEEVELSVLLTDDAKIHALNREWRAKDQPTDVLAFAMREGEGAPAGELLGDIVISIETARRQAREHDRALLAEVTFLLAHGLLHLLGYDHATDAEERRMSARTDALCAAASAKKAPKTKVREIARRR